SPFTVAAGVSDPGGIAVGDFNGDNYPDLAVGGEKDGVGVLLNCGNCGGFSAPVKYATFGGNLTSWSFVSGASVAAGDINGDGTLDLAYADYNLNQLVIFVGTGSGTFQAGVAVATGPAPT